MVNGKPLASTTCEQHAELVHALSLELLELSSFERVACSHDDCLVMAGIVRDCARAVQKAALERLDRLALPVTRAAAQSVEGVDSPANSCQCTDDQPETP